MAQDASADPSDVYVFEAFLSLGCA